MIVRRATVTAPRTLAARIAKLEAVHSSSDERQALIAELMEATKEAGVAQLMKPVIARCCTLTTRK